MVVIPPPSCFRHIIWNLGVMFTRALGRRLQVTARTPIARPYHTFRGTLPYGRYLALVCAFQFTVPPELTTRQTSIAVGSGLTLCAVSSWSPIHADAPNHQHVVPGKTDERSLQGAGLIPMSEVSTHDRRDDCWVVVDGQVWDMTGVSPLLRRISPDRLLTLI